jgi:hypothetical protein|tara:strand:- start:11729 stop:14971 length:3243 start_codon:yes stop_codon:yes gene_type:complete
MKTGLKLALLLFLLAISTILGLSQVTAADWDNRLTYEDEDMTAIITNAFGLGKQLGKATLTSHESPTHIRNVIRGEDRVVMYYDFKDWDLYGNGLGEVSFINKRNGREIEKDYHFVKEVYTYSTYNTYEDVCSDVYNDINKTWEEVCIKNKTGTEEVKKASWEKIGKDIPKGDVRIGLATDVDSRDYIDAIWKIAGQQVSKHADWTESLNTDIVAYWAFANASDVTGNGHDLGTNEGTPAYTASGCKIGSCFSSTSDNNLNLNGDGEVDFGYGDNDFTWSVWVLYDNVAASGYFFGRGAAYSASTGNDGANTDYWGSDWWSPSGAKTGAVGSSDTWYQYTMVYDASESNLTLWKDATPFFSYDLGTIQDGGAIDTNFGTRGKSDYDLNGKMDEMGYWNRALSNSEVVQIYNGGTGMTYIADFPNPPAISFISPLSQNLTSSQTLEFSSNASDDVEVTNITLIINGVANYTQTGSATTLTFNQSLTLGDGTYDYYFKASDDEGSTASTGNQSIIVDSVAPLINITSPLNDTNYLATQTPFNVTINYTISDINLQSCWYYNGSSNVSLTCGNNITQGLDPGWTYFIIYANDSLGNQNSRAINLFINSLSYGVEYQNTIIEGQNSTFYLNITATNITTLAGNLTYNSTKYSLEEVTNNGTFGRFSRTLTAPLVTADRNHTFNFSFALNGVLFNTSTYSQIVYNIPALVVQSSVCSPAAYNFSLHDEQNLTDITGTFEYNFRYGTTANNTFVSTFGQVSNTHELYLCINDSLSSAGNWSLGSGEIFYRSPSYVDRRYYLFEDSELSNKTRNVSLFDLLSTTQTSFKLEVEDTSLSPFVEKFTSLLRWYPDLNEYKVVEMGQTDENGNTILHVRTEDVDYRIAVYERNGSLIKLEDPTRFVCLVDPCTYTLRISPGERDFTSIFDLDYSFTFNRSTSIWDLIYSDSSELTTGINLTIYKLTGTSILPICSNIATGSTGAVSCNTSGYTGTLKGVAVRTASPGVALAEMIITTTTTAFSSQFGLWLALLIAIPIVFIFSMMSPIAAVIGGVIAIIPAFYFGAISWAVIGGIIILGGITIHFLKRVG